MQNIIAMVYDFDKTLSPDYMQRPLFEANGIVEKEFWTEKEEFCKKQRSMGLLVEEDTAYLHQIIQKSKQGGPLEGLTQDLLREYGARLRLFPGLPEFFTKIRQGIEEDLRYKAYEIKIEHYIASTGLVEMLRGSGIAPFMKGMEACEFFYDESRRPIGVAKALSNAQKTEILFKINKGVYHDPSINVNASMPDDIRRIPFQNMIYFGDGPSDVPCMSIVRKNGGFALAVYDPKPENINFVENPMRNAYDLHRGKRVDDIAPADYRAESHLYLLARNMLETIANRIIDKQRYEARKSHVPAPGHHDFYDS